MQSSPLATQTQPTTTGTPTSDSTNQFSERSVLKTFDINAQPSSKKNMAQSNRSATIILLVIAIAAGVSTGYGGYKLKNKTVANGPGGNSEIQQVAGDSVKAGDVFGVQDKNTFKDTAEGYLEKGGLDGEGSHKLLRAGGDSQTVYLTSSITDLDKFVGMEVKIAGETFKGQKAGWLMDVGRVEVVKVKGEIPQEN